jgi:hypothetical protein
MRDCTSEHAATVGTKAPPKGNAFVPNSLPAGQPV